METNDVQIKIEQGKEEKKKIKMRRHQQRKKTARNGNTRTSGSQGARGGVWRRDEVAEQQNNRIRHQGKQGSESKSEEGDTVVATV